MPLPAPGSRVRMIAEIPLPWGDSYVETEGPCPHPVGDVRIPDPMGSRGARPGERGNRHRPSFAGAGIATPDRMREQSPPTRQGNILSFSA